MALAGRAPSAIPAPAYSKIARKLPLLFSRLVSPGTASTDTFDFRGRARGDPGDRHLRRRGLARFELFDRSGGLVLLAPRRHRDTVTLTLVEVDSPAFSTDTLNVGLPPPLRWLSVGSAASSVDPTLTPFSALPWVPLVVGWALWVPCAGQP